MSTMTHTQLWTYIKVHYKLDHNQGHLCLTNTSFLHDDIVTSFLSFQTVSILQRRPPFGGDNVLRESSPVPAAGSPGQIPIHTHHLSVRGSGHFLHTHGSPPENLGTRNQPSWWIKGRNRSISPIRQVTCDSIIYSADPRGVHQNDTQVFVPDINYPARCEVHSNNDNVL